MPSVKAGYCYRCECHQDTNSRRLTKSLQGEKQDGSNTSFTMRRSCRCIIQRLAYSKLSHSLDDMLAGLIVGNATSNAGKKHSKLKEERLGSHRSLCLGRGNSTPINAATSTALGLSGTLQGTRWPAYQCFFHVLTLCCIQWRASIRRKLPRLFYFRKRRLDGDSLVHLGQSWVI